MRELHWRGHHQKRVHYTNRSLLAVLAFSFTYSITTDIIATVITIAFCVNTSPVCFYHIMLSWLFVFPSSIICKFYRTWFICGDFLIVEITKAGCEFISVMLNSNFTISLRRMDKGWLMEAKKLFPAFKSYLGKRWSR